MKTCMIQSDSFLFSSIASRLYIVCTARSPILVLVEVDDVVLGFHSDSVVELVVFDHHDHG